MKYTSPLFLSLCFCAVFFLSSCLDDKEEIIQVSYTDDEYELLTRSLDLPNPVFDYEGAAFGSGVFVHFEDPFHPSPNFPNGFFSSPINHRATLGRVLFYDTRLSKNNQVSCASCHLQEKAFADPARFSEGFDGELTKRNSLALGNIRFYSSNRFFWDERAHSVEEQTHMTIEDHIEMGMDIEDLPAKLENDEYYRILFKKGFGEERIIPDRIKESLAHFVRHIVSNQSEYDQALVNSNFNPNQGFADFTTEENLGKALYQTNCASCHGHDLNFTMVDVANNGLDEVYSDKGVGAITFNAADNGKFKVPILRNVALTAPYMHDGRFETLEEVIDHYAGGVKNHSNLHPNLRQNFNGNPISLEFTDTEKEALIAFLHTLTDQQFLKDEKFADPFK
jgi:cytochrome c peroxidase